MATGIPPDLTDAATAVKKGVVPVIVPVGASPKTGQIWPRGSKAAGN